MDQPSECHKVYAALVHSDLGRLLCLLSDGLHVNEVMDRTVGLVRHTRKPPERFDDGSGSRHKGIKMLEFSFEAVPQHPIFPLIFVFDLHIVVDEHDALPGRYRQRSHRAGALVGVEIHREIKQDVLREIIVDMLQRIVEGYKGIEARGRIQVMDLQLFRKVQIPEVLLL